MKLYSYFRSSASYRVRIALNLKGLDYEYVPIHLLRNGGEQLTPAYRELNPDGLVPTLVEGGAPLNQSLAILEYLEETHPEPPLLPREPLARAQVRAFALQIACEIHPINNLRVLRYLTSELGASEGAKNAWYRHWIQAGFASLEAQLVRGQHTGTFCYGDTPTFADLCLVPQVFNGQRFEIDIQHYPTLQRIYDAAMRLDAFANAAPAQQPDAE